MEMKSPKEPLVKGVVDLTWEAFERDGFSNGRLVGSPQGKLSLEDVMVDTAVFEGTDFTKLNLEKVDFQNVVFRHCNFLNLDFSKRYFGRIRFEGCNLML